MYHPLYTYGYSGRQPYHLRALAEHLDAVVVDIRFSPRSRVPDWNAGRLQKLLGERYRPLPALGNRNYKGGPIVFVDLEAGVTDVGELLQKQPVILLCACRDLQRCHRLPAAEAIAVCFNVAMTHC
ncbi:MAG: hypothetical protein Kow0031_22890 [Anaerolineae bacterium]